MLDAAVEGRRWHKAYPEPGPRALRIFKCPECHTWCKAIEGYEFCNCAVFRKRNGRWVRMRSGTRSMLMALALAYPKALNVEELVEVLWPDPEREPDSARTLIRQFVYYARRAGFGVECTTHGYGQPEHTYYRLGPERP